MTTDLAPLRRAEELLARDESVDGIVNELQMLFGCSMVLALVAAALWPLFMLPGGDYPFVGATVFIVSWLVFLADLVVHKRHRVRYLHTWLGRFDLLVVVLTAPWFLLLGPSESK